jgi:hypothetical protein
MGLPENYLLDSTNDFLRIECGRVCSPRTALCCPGGAFSRVGPLERVEHALPGGEKMLETEEPKNTLFVSIPRFLPVSNFTEKTALRFGLVSSLVSLRFRFPAYIAKRGNEALRPAHIPYDFS